MFNLILALFIYSMVLFTWGDQYMDLHKVENGFVFNEKAKEILPYLAGDDIDAINENMSSIFEGEKLMIT
jgi:hypothetical protein